ncbi:CCA tRNA nucleotidyltransferase [Synechococcus elongatus]|uniref:PolyA polymerase n=1 Tax=Synechococcus elongatus (strain ATCC 33912 / PCC 7942 / FACHB-805) TaxID=1140 RepID=Q31Q46_SYNE7|nr:CCA tRNA nucleotidyltransferase [Synechococcus elongatus]ABB56823.1 polyA polymerase [Synechococcus elongatus PCC 7942 = FACHB-805]AJD58648.1 poly(A) polymerase [Synechococcus elongatus UTEX 2973]MBD2588693.1 CCA tRNA nucleotidyltransferase [Synechococcus elongatus FACHB-242]MBD2689719.1 CCA tRNA nucleotidyltransferase [Synechococcus elongatus FACHB-1061]MBD2708325.1 CCA tRNA nucleotidyltransferase [Synechococcus elongatus PCC 7942 = FACHB-805]
MDAALAARFNPQAWPFSADGLPAGACLVGGAVRDALLGRLSDPLDLDWVVPNGAVETARSLARQHQAGFVLLDADRQIARVVFADMTVDFAQQEGDRLEQDLRRRDFTINAIAYDWQRQTVIDPLGGQADLEQGLLRMVAPENLVDDPLRLLRAYRQAAQLSFSIEPETAAAIAQLAPLLPQVAGERIWAELQRLLNVPPPHPVLVEAIASGLLAPWFPEATPECMSTLADHWQQLQAQAPEWPHWFTAIGPGGRLSHLAYAWLTRLLPSDRDRALESLLALKSSRAEQRSLLQLQQHWQDCQTSKAATTAGQVALFQTLGKLVPVLLVQLEASELRQTLLRRYQTPNDPIAHLQPLVSGTDLQVSLGIRGGPRLGQLLQDLRVAQAEQQFSDSAGAIAFAARWLQESPLPQ